VWLICGNSKGLDVSAVPPYQCAHEQYCRRRPVAHHLWGLTPGRLGVARKTGSSQGPFLLGELTLERHTGEDESMAENMIMTGAEMVLRALAEHGVKHVFGYPGGAVLPIYDEFFQQDKVKHILVRHEQGATHMAEGYARSTGLCGVAPIA
jgi:Thiamine pyrophosphate enzyme, N-terminal TPP binding domain